MVCLHLSAADQIGMYRARHGFCAIKAQELSSLSKPARVPYELLFARQRIASSGAELPTRGQRHAAIERSLQVLGDGLRSGVAYTSKPVFRNGSRPLRFVIFTQVAEADFERQG